MTPKQPDSAPRQEDAEQLFLLLASDDRRLCREAERSLARLGPSAAEQAQARLAAARPPLRARLCRLLGRIAASSRDPALTGVLLELLDDGDLKTRRSAVIVLGKLVAPSPGAELPAEAGAIEQRLLARWAAGGLELAERRSLVLALGKIGSAATMEALGEEQSEDPELGRLLEEARLKLRRTLGRDTPGHIDPRRRAPRPLLVRFHCRAGLEAVLAEEIGADLQPEARPPAWVDARWAGSLERLQRPRTALWFGFPLPPRELAPGEDVAVAVADALCAPDCRGLLHAFTVGPIRFRLEWAGAGHRRAQSFRVAAEVARRWPELQNDPTRSLWELVVRQGRKLQLELWPRGLPDPRFAYRRRDLPAASHPTVAAALARTAGVREDDVCWDPFVGSGLELCERGLLGPYRRLFGSDLDPVALEAAGENLAAAGLQHYQLEQGDARWHSPAERPSLILTNPPMGRRLLHGQELTPLLEAFLRRAAELLLASGRIVWINPLPDGGLPVLAAAGLRPERRQRLDMGGFHAELQLLRKD